MNDEINLLDLVDEWKVKFKKSMDNQVELRLKANSDAKIEDLKEEFFLNKLAVLYVGNVNLSKEIKSLKERIEFLEGKLAETVKND